MADRCGARVGELLSPGEPRRAYDGKLILEGEIRTMSARFEIGGGTFDELEIDQREDVA